MIDLKQIPDSKQDLDSYELSHLFHSWSLQPGKNPKAELAARLGELGMMAMAANPGNVVALAPPLIVTREEIDEGLAIMDRALEVADRHAVS